MKKVENYNKKKLKNKLKSYIKMDKKIIKFEDTEMEEQQCEMQRTRTNYSATWDTSIKNFIYKKLPAVTWDTSIKKNKQKN